MKGKWILILLCGLMVGSALYSALRQHWVESVHYESIDSPASRFSPRQRPLEVSSNPARTFGTAIADAVEKVMPSVVVIRTERSGLVKKEIRVFGFRQQTIVPERLAGEGSGVIIDERGYLLTSWHLLRGAQQVDVVLNDGTKLQAHYIGHDEATDLAVLKIKVDGGSCPVAEFGDSDAVRVGEVAIAIGSPFSLQSSVTVGHVSQKGRRIKILPYEDFIQTDAAMNEGNSGGPLIDVDGRLIGINAAIQTDDSKHAVGIGFAVPSNLAMVITKSLIEDGHHEWPWVGADFSQIDPGLRNSLFSGVGVMVTQVWNDTPASRVGLLPGDVVLRVDGLPMKDDEDVKRVLYNHAVGEELTFEIQRGNELKYTLNIELEEFPGEVD